MEQMTKRVGEKVHSLRLSRGLSSALKFAQKKSKQEARFRATCVREKGAGSRQCKRGRFVISLKWYRMGDTARGFSATTKGGSTWWEAGDRNQPEMLFPQADGATFQATGKDASEKKKPNIWASDVLKKREKVKNPHRSLMEKRDASSAEDAKRTDSRHVWS